MLPSIFGENMFDDFFSDSFGMMVPQTRDALYGKHAKNLMKTDIRETDTSYELDIDLPGFKKDEVSIDLKDGYLTISAAKGLDKDAEDFTVQKEEIDYVRWFGLEEAIEAVKNNTIPNCIYLEELEMVAAATR